MQADSPIDRDLRLHLDANDIDAGGDGAAGDPAEGGDVAVWRDRSGNGNDLSAVSGRPVVLGNQMNGHAVVEFASGADYLQRGDVVGGLTGSPALDVFVVLDVEAGVDFFGFGSGAGGQTKHYSTRTICWFNNGNQQFTNTPLAGQGPVIGNFIAPASGTYLEHRFRRNGAEATRSSGTNPGNRTNFPATGNFTRLGAGIVANGNPSHDFADRVAEVLVFATELSAIERSIVENYLSARHAIPLEIESADLYRGDDIELGDLDEDVAGIGRVGTSSLLEARSAGLFVRSGSFPDSDGDSLLFGHGSSSFSWSASDVAAAPSVTSRLSREWFFDRRGDGGLIDLSFELVDEGLDSPGGDEVFALLIRDDRSQSFHELEASGRLVDGTVVFENVDVDLLADRYVTLGSSITVEQAPADVSISEIMAINVLTLDDRQGDSSDWIEIRNESAVETVDLSGWYLTDDVGDLRRWQFPEGVELSPNEHLVVFASGKDLRTAGQELHTSFRLSSQGDVVILLRPDGDTIVDAFFPAYGPQFQDVAFGRPFGEGEPTYLAEATPGRPNAGPGSIGPIIEEPAHLPVMPLANEDIVVTAQVSELLAGVVSVELVYRVMYGAESAPIEMKDDGTDPDPTAGDGEYTAVIPSAAFDPGEMVRWVITARDVEGNARTSPLFPDATASPEYHGTVVTDPAINSSLPTLHWFLRPGTESAANSRTGTRASIFFDGEFYDNVFVRIRGGSTAGLAKKSYKFDLNPRHHFRFHPDAGRVSEFNLNTTYTDKSYIRQPLSYSFYDIAGCPGPECFLVRVERGGNFFSVAAFTEQPDDDLLRREGLPDEGAIYKMFNTFTSATSRVEKKNRRYENNQDLAAFISAMNGRSGNALRTHVFDHVDLPRVLGYLAATVLTQHNDSMAKNYYLYRDSEGSGEWCFFPWDVDLTFGRHYMTNDNILGDPLWADEDWVLGGRQANVPISPSHPFMGIQELPGNRSWNRLVDALLEVPDVRVMFRRRLRTLLDTLLQPPETPGSSRVIESALDDLEAQIVADVTLDTNRWGQFGSRQTLAQAIELLERRYLDVRRVHFFETHAVENLDDYPEANAFSAELPSSQPVDPTIEFGAIEFRPASGDQDEEFIELRNPNDFAVDISDWRLTGGVEHTFRRGTVVLPGSTIHVSPHVRTFRARATSPTGGEGLFVQGDYSGHLSSLGETICLESAGGAEITCVTYEGDPSAAQLHLRVSEVHYHPLPPTAPEAAAGIESADAFEFIELVNTSATETLDLTEISFTEGIEFDFASGDIQSLAPGEIVLVVGDREAFDLRHGAGLPVAGEYTGFRLDNGGERVKIDDGTGSTVSSFRYDDDPEAGWPTEADGGGSSLEVVDLDGDLDDPANWRASVAASGTPGRLSTIDEGPRFIRGDSNLDGTVDLSDGVHILLYLFAGTLADCLDASDVTDDEEINITDAVNLLDYLFRGGSSPPAPFPRSGVEPVAEGPLDCERGL